jgi:hypothetical protein
MKSDLLGRLWHVKVALYCIGYMLLQIAKILAHRISERLFG